MQIRSARQIEVATDWPGALAAFLEQLRQVPSNDAMLRRSRLPAVQAGIRMTLAIRCADDVTRLRTWLEGADGDDIYRLSVVYRVRDHHNRSDVQAIGLAVEFDRRSEVFGGAIPADVPGSAASQPLAYVPC